MLWLEPEHIFSFMEKKKFLHVSHDSIPPFIPENAKILILGSFPSPGSRKAGFYYAYKTNRFFKILSFLFSEEEPITTEERKSFLCRHRIALYDVIESCDIVGASDSSIRNVTASDIGKIRKGSSSIGQVFTTGIKAAELYRKYHDEDFISLPSPSAANAGMSLTELIGKYSVILSFLN